MVSGAAKIDPALLEQITPHRFAGEDLLSVPEPLKPLFPWGGLQRGWSVGLDGHGAWSLGLSIIAAALGNEGWLAVVGAHDLNLAAGYADRLVALSHGEIAADGSPQTVLTSDLLNKVFEVDAEVRSGAGGRPWVSYEQRQQGPDRENTASW